MMLISTQEEKVDPRIKRTRALIQQAFMELFNEKDFQSITVQDITEKAEVNRATFYAHYADKYALLDASIQQTFRKELDQRTLNACRYSEQNLCALICTVCDFVSWAGSRCPEANNQFETLVEQQVRNQIQNLLEHWAGELNTTVDQKLAVIAASWSIYGLALHWKTSKSALSADAYAEHILPLIIDSLHLKSGKLKPTEGK
jgi:Transcriptional regulator